MVISFMPYSAATAAYPRITYQSKPGQGSLAQTFTPSAVRASA